MKEDLEAKKKITDLIWEDSPLDETEVSTLMDYMNNINVIDLHGDIILNDLLFAFGYKKIGRELIKYAVNKGADVNYEIEGFNCLFKACLTRDFEIVEFLLNKGANPNCISTDTHESLLDWVEWDYWFEKGEGSQWAESYVPIIELLKKYGAKPAGNIGNQCQ